MSSADPSPVPASDGDGRPGIAAVDGVLPRELLIEVLLLLPAKEVCSVRAVCPSWRSLTYDPLFVAAYAARHPGPLLAVRSRSTRSIDLVDLSGDVVKRVYMEGYDLWVLCTRFEYVLIQGHDHSIIVLDPVSGSVSTLPFGIAEGLTFPGSGHPFWLAFGQVASTGEYKLIRVVEEDIMCGGYGNDPLCEVFTFRTGTRNWGRMIIQLLIQMKLDSGGRWRVHRHVLIQVAQMEWSLKRLSVSSLINGSLKNLTSTTITSSLAVYLLSTSRRSSGVRLSEG